MMVLTQRHKTESQKDTQENGYEATVEERKWVLTRFPHLFWSINQPWNHVGASNWCHFWKLRNRKVTERNAEKLIHVCYWASYRITEETQQLTWNAAIRNVRSKKWRLLSKIPFTSSVSFSVKPWVREIREEISETSETSIRTPWRWLPT